MGTDKTDPLKQNQIPSLPLIRAGREVRGQNFFNPQIPFLSLPVVKFDEGLETVSSSMSASLPLWSKFFKNPESRSDPCQS